MMATISWVENKTHYRLCLIVAEISVNNWYLTTIIFIYKLIYKGP